MSRLPVASQPDQAVILLGKQTLNDGQPVNPVEAEVRIHEITRHAVALCAVTALAPGLCFARAQTDK